MGFPETPKPADSPTKPIITAAPLRSPLKPIYTAGQRGRGGQSAERDDLPTTPTSAESRIPPVLTCPPAPKKRKASRAFKCDGVREFFNPPDLETVFAWRH